VPARRRFFVEAPLAVGEIHRLDALAHQLATVLRLKSGDAITLINGDGYEYLAVLTELSPRRAAGQVQERHPTNTDPQIDLTLYLCSLKQDKFEWVLQKATELGATHIVPVVSQRSVVRPVSALAAKHTRWSTILREATEQCGRTRPPGLANPVKLSEIKLPKDVYGFLAWEEAGEDAPTLGQAVGALCPAGLHALPSLALFIGPEGGLAPDEVQSLIACGWRIVTLGRRILRAETAALAGLAIILDRCGEL
jgi:16S rRNA (uracil1498-N3)-methyltransferase